MILLNLQNLGRARRENNGLDLWQVFVMEENKLQMAEFIIWLFNLQKAIMKKSQPTFTSGSLIYF